MSGGIEGIPGRIDETHAMLYEGKDIRPAVRNLMTRELKAED